jgi:DNA-directed RNA polymerase specialized sigma24 family protein
MPRRVLLSIHTTMPTFDQPWDDNLFPDSCQESQSEQLSEHEDARPDPTENVSDDTGIDDDVGGFGEDLLSKLTDAHIAHQFKKFNETFEEIVSRQSSSAVSLFPFIRGKLFQFGLWQQYDEVAILQEVYSRTIEKILAGRTITNPYAWIRSVAFRYIRELSRKNHRHISVDDALLEVLAPTEGIDEQFLTDEMLKLRKAFNQLSDEERLLLSLKAVQDLSWIEIQRAWTREGYGKLSLPTLRKRKERALSRLRKIYHAL